MLWRAVDDKPIPKWVAQGLKKSVHPLEDTVNFVIDESLSSVSDNARIDTPMQQPTPREFQGPPPTENPATKKLRKLGVSISGVAVKCGVTYSAARSWFQKGKHGRTVPAKHYPTLKREYGILASDLPNGVAEK